ncbi:hypothetical protein ACFWYW_59080 [Nonomuraea sp. NPDC059023]|uniref:hypothetical protein n=1 Tax=unclassified Nonomuraea TaxID=2593643 RepID=UPI0036912800
MAEINIPSGPIDVEPVHAITCDPDESARRANTTALRAALDGIPLGDWDRTILAWLAGWEPSTVATVCSLLRRVREARDGRC